MDQMKHFPARLKTYASFDHMQRTLRGYLKINVLVTELKSEALKVGVCLRRLAWLPAWLRGGLLLENDVRYSFFIVVQERHWKQLMKRLRVSWLLSDLTLGQLWAVDLQKNESVVRDVILVAQGEMALEEFLKQVGLPPHSLSIAVDA